MGRCSTMEGHYWKMYKLFTRNGEPFVILEEIEWIRFWKIWQLRMIWRTVVPTPKINKLKFKLFFHPPYSPELAPINCYLFPNLKKGLAGKKFKSNEEVINAANKYFDGIKESDCKNGITALEHLYEKFISSDRDCI